jgi:hypothetical protein
MTTAAGIPQGASGSGVSFQELQHFGVVDARKHSRRYGGQQV